MEKQISLTTRFQKGWNARIAVVGGISEIEAGEGISINGNTISLLSIPGVAGSYTNPTVTVDETGRVVDIENGTLPSALNADLVEDIDGVSSYSGDAFALVVIDAGDGRSALYVRDESNVFQGPAYITGSRGLPGQDGIDGADGANGSTGETGEKGEAGERGPEGPQGQRGPQGESGPAGAQGLNGSEGPQGPQGVMGPIGATLTPNAYGTLDEAMVASIQGRPGNYFFLVDPDGDVRANKLVPSGISGDMSLHLIGWNGASFRDYGQLTGAQGPQGIQGPQGPQGERGPQGLTGATGAQGVAGAQGERGIAGQNGAQGPQGIAGQAGATGPQGPQGERGLQGIQGATGVKGDKGDAGEVGPQGPAGADGEAGPAGPAGLSGASRVLLREVTSTVAGPEDFATGINASQYDHIYITFTGFFSSDATAVMTLRLGNGSYLSSGYYSTIDSDASVNATAHVILSGGGSTSLDRSSGEVCLRLNREVCVGHSRRSSGSTPGVRRIVSILPSIANFNQLRFSASSGNMGAGVTIRVYGVR